MAYVHIHDFALHSKPCDVRLDRHSSLLVVTFEAPVDDSCRTTSNHGTHCKVLVSKPFFFVVWQDKPTAKGTKMPVRQGARPRARPGRRCCSSPVDMPMAVETIETFDPLVASRTPWPPFTVEPVFLVFPRVPKAFPPFPMTREPSNPA